MSKTEKPERIVAASEDDVRKYGAGSDVPVAASEAEAPSGEGGESSEVSQIRDKLLRARAELSNIQRRAAKEKSDAVRFAVADFARDVLSVVDDFERTLAAADSEPDTGIVEGARLVYDNLMKILRSHHIEGIEAEGQPFDPACHEAVMQQPSDEHPPQTVLQEIQRGYRLHDRLLRPAKVIVSAAPPGESAGERQDVEGAEPV